MRKFLTLGELIKAYRAHHGTSQSDLASKLDVDIRTVIRWEKNETLLNNEKEAQLAEATFIPYQVIRNLNSANQIPVFYDFGLRKYSLSSLSNELPNANWIKSKLDVGTERLKPISSEEDITQIIRHTELQNNPLKSTNKNLLLQAAKNLPELNMVLFDQSGYYSGHCVYFSISLATYQKIRSKEMEENQLTANDLVNYKTQDNPIFYCHSITADCNENFFYIIGAVLKFYRDKPLHNYLYALLTSRYDSHNMSNQLGVKTVWEDHEVKEKYNLIDAPRLVEGTFESFLR
ncbi:helix-turn-helix transcriptional regulator [Winogradskyella sp. DF17]|uniref:Helix-turn-helix transcriptional regulator n=1 Tax=Winogradskyella pelagia TaxID=2819984 RepID=A0ABS3SYZ1_9FLAO|nr:helix-turn-helix transcriptional regulator [Winogradskyella sp. DF17]